MRAAVLTGHGDLDKLEIKTDWPVPTPSENQVLIKVAACGMNNTDINTRSGWYSKAVTEATTGGSYDTVDTDDPSWGGAPLSFPRIQGADVCGEIVAVGQRVDSELIGKRVITDNWLRDWDDELNPNKTGYFGSECDGGYAEYTVIDHRHVGVINNSMTDVELATFSCSYSTAEGMLSRAEVTEKDTVACGADALLPRHSDNLAAALKQAIGRDTVSVVADIVGGEGFSSVLDRIERGGRYTCSGAIAGPLVSLDLRTFYLRDLTFTGSTFLMPHIFGDLVGYIERGEVKPMVAATYPLESIHQAQRDFVEKKFTGNLVITL